MYSSLTLEISRISENSLTTVRNEPPTSKYFIIFYCLCIVLFNSGSYSGTSLFHYILINQQNFHSPRLVACFLE